MNIKSFKNSAKLVLASALALGGLAVMAPAAQADPVPAGSELYIAGITAFQRGDINLVYAVSTTFTTAVGAAVPPGTIIQVDVYSCGNFLQRSNITYDGSQPGQVTNLSPTGQLDGTENSVNKRVGPSLDLVATIVQPGYDAYARTANFSGYSVSRPSCEQINGGTPPPTDSKVCQVTKWSEKVSTARSGKNAFIGGPAKVSATKSSNCSVKYTWTLNGKKVKSGKTIFLKRSMRGKKLSMMIEVSKSGFKGAKKTLSYGRVRSR